MRGILAMAAVYCTRSHRRASTQRLVRYGYGTPIRERILGDNESSRDRDYKDRETETDPDTDTSNTQPDTDTDTTPTRHRHTDAGQRVLVEAIRSDRNNALSSSLKGKARSQGAKPEEERASHTRLKSQGQSQTSRGKARGRESIAYQA